MAPKPKQVRTPEDREQHFIAEWREARGKSQEWLAEKLDVHHSTVSRIEGRRSPYSQDFLEDVSTILGVSVSDLLFTNPLGLSEFERAVVQARKSDQRIKDQVIGFIASKIGSGPSEDSQSTPGKTAIVVAKKGRPRAQDQQELPEHRARAAERSDASTHKSHPKSK